MKVDPEYVSAYNFHTHLFSVYWRLVGPQFSKRELVTWSPVHMQARSVPFEPLCPVWTQVFSQRQFSEDSIFDFLSVQFSVDYIRSIMRVHGINLWRQTLIPTIYMSALQTPQMRSRSAFAEMIEFVGLRINGPHHTVAGAHVFDQLLSLSVFGLHMYLHSCVFCLRTYLHSCVISNGVIYPHSCILPTDVQSFFCELVAFTLT